MNKWVKIYDDAFNYGTEVENQYKRAIQAVAKAAAEDMQERCAVASWTHFMEQCAKLKINPSEVEGWLSASAIRALPLEEK